MESPRLSVRISQPLLQRLSSHVNQQGLTVSNEIIAATTCYLGETDPLPTGDQVHILEQRLARLEGKG